MIPSLDEPFSAPPPGAKNDPAPAQAGRVDHRSAASACRASVRESALAASFRPRPGELAEQLRLQRAKTVASGAARLAGRRIRARRLEVEEAALSDDDVASLSAVVGSSRARVVSQRKTPTTSSSGAARGEGRMPKRFATRSWLSSGRLDVRLGGPSFKPVISQEALEGLSQKGRDFVPSPASEQGRRSLYMYSRRGLVASASDDV